MTILQEGNHTGEFLLSEANGTRSREQVVFAAAAPAMVSGTVVGKITAGGKWTAYSNVAADGSEVAAGVLYTALPDAAADQVGVVIVRHAEVATARLTGSDTPGLADLLALGIVAR